MANTAHICFNAEDRSYFAILKKAIHNIVSEAGFSEQKISAVDIIIAEIASNLLKHAGGGEILVKLICDNGVEGVEILSVDSGKGMSDPIKMLEDGMSTTNTLGHGLGAIKRMSDVFQIYSIKDWGTILLSRVYKTSSLAVSKNAALEVRGLNVAKPGEELSGDGYSFLRDANYLKIFLGDGLGHGEDANKAVVRAISAFEECNEVLPVQALRHIHNVVRKTRGLVGTLAVYSIRERLWRISGVGNIASRTYAGLVAKNYMSYNGIIGMNVPNTMKEQIVEGQRGQLLIMCSDGIRTRWDLQKYTGIFKYDLSVIAAAIYKDYARKTDDMSVMVARLNKL